MKPYEMTKYSGKYHIRTSMKLSYPAAALRPTKNSVGLAYTQARSGHGSFSLIESQRQKDVRRLNLFGTLDSLLQKKYQTVKLSCSSCGCKCNGKIALKRV